jgi:TatD DNase family protein
VDPHRAATADANRLDELRELLAHPKAVAVGETGLDGARRHAAPEQQRRLFAAQLGLAEDLGLPVVIHSRDAAAETAAALAGFGGTVVLHCFSSPELLAPALERRYYVSFAGNVTFPKASELRDAAAAVPRDRILVETDSPYLAPQPVRGRPNEPAHLVHTIAALADVRGEEPAALGAAAHANAAAAFSLP